MKLTLVMCSNYADFQLLAGRFKFETVEMYYRNAPYSGVGSGQALFNAWAFDYIRGIIFSVALEIDFQSQQPATSVMPATFLTDFPQAVALAGQLQFNV